MLLSLGNVITIAVVVLILVAFRIADSRNRPNVDKLKRQSDMLTEKFASFVEERTTEVRTLSAELAASLKNGAEILKRARAFEETLAARAGDIEAIGRKFKEYDAALSELDAMSGRVDQNLKRVREESAFLDQAGKRLAKPRARSTAWSPGSGRWPPRRTRRTGPRSSGRARRSSPRPRPGPAPSASR